MVALLVTLAVCLGLVGGPVITAAATAAATASAATVTPTNAAVRIRPVPSAQWKQMVAVGAWHKGCPATQKTLRRIELNYHGFDGLVHRGVLVVNADVASSIASVMTTLFARGFKIHRIQPIEFYKGDDNASMAADNTSAYNCRKAAQSNASAAISPHANGRAIDINPYENPWVDWRCKCFRPDTYYGTHRSGTGVITKSGEVWQAFTRAGWVWQDSSTPDFQHFDTGYPSKTFMPIAVNVGNAKQLITVATHGTYATVSAWQLSSAGWHRVMTTSTARIGSGGLVAGARRHQGSNTTPSGTYALTQAFGIAANPGAALPYHRVTNSDWWVEDNASRWYNSLRTKQQGGFRTSLPESSVNGSEHLIVHKTQYQYAIVIDYNMHPAVRYRGAGIFLHVSDGHPTAGCVSVPRNTMSALLRWLKPSALPRITIG
jgi:L,D-peptidoglycan transpeptidase YkuD (ErfK/YbiS/YcfS/YnhG family)